MAVEESELLCLNIEHINRMKLEYVEIYDQFIKESEGSLQGLLMRKLKAMDSCQKQFDDYFAGEYDKKPLMTYHLDCIDIKDLDEQELSNEDLSSVEMNDIVSENLSSVSGSEDLENLKDDQEIKRQSKMMLNKLKFQN